MALIVCPDCGTQASDQAPACPRCARPLRAFAPKKGMGVGLIIGLVALLVLLPVLGILAISAIFGTRKYIANAKTAEAKNTLGQLAKLAVASYEAEAVSTGGTVKRRLCPSASGAVPADRMAVSGKKYMSTSADWQKDQSANAGFACLRFEMGSPQYFQYEYQSTETGFTVRAHGDLDGNGTFSTFELKGQVVDDHVVIAPAILEVHPEE
ncbi:MAG TPA: hypothetical protein VLT33_40775 [Labilithrix sp.]|nr:hypothetical protein [Labilithrix sp.]